MKFRCYKIGLISDIKRVFLNVGVSGADLDVLRFLWVNEINDVNPEIFIWRFTQFCLVTSCLRVDPEFAIKVFSEIYADDLTNGGHNSILTRGWSRTSKMVH